MEWVLVTEPEPERCEAVRAKSGKGVVRCESPKSHVTSGEFGDNYHMGRGRTGNWFSWPVEEH